MLTFKKQLKKGNMNSRNPASDKPHKITILGSGTSTGIPLVGCQCPVCISDNPKNKRLRTSIYLETALGKRILIDTTPDLRTQLLAHKINHVDAVIITHEHADHLHGIDDLRPLCFSRVPEKIPIHVAKPVVQTISDRFPYIFRPKQPILGGGIPLLDLLPVEEGKKEIQGEMFFFFMLPHGPGKTLGFTHGKFAYLIDCHVVPDKIVEMLRQYKLDFILIDCVRRQAHQTHLNVDKAFDYLRRIAPKRAGLIHMAHQLDHQVLLEEAKDFFDFPVFPVYDGQQINYLDGEI